MLAHARGDELVDAGREHEQRLVGRCIARPARSRRPRTTRGSAARSAVAPRRARPARAGRRRGSRARRCERSAARRRASRRRRAARRAGARPSRRLVAHRGADARPAARRCRAGRPRGRPPPCPRTARRTSRARCARCGNVGDGRRRVALVRDDLGDRLEHARPRRAVARLEQRLDAPGGRRSATAPRLAYPTRYARIPARYATTERRAVHELAAAVRAVDHDALGLRGAVARVDRREVGAAQAALGRARSAGSRGRGRPCPRRTARRRRRCRCR